MSNTSKLGFIVASLFAMNVHAADVAPPVGNPMPKSISLPTPSMPPALKNPQAPSTPVPDKPQMPSAPQAMPTPNVPMPSPVGVNPSPAGVAPMPTGGNPAPQAMPTGGLPPSPVPPAVQGQIQPQGVMPGAMPAPTLSKKKVKLPSGPSADKLEGSFGPKSAGKAKASGETSTKKGQACKANKDGTLECGQLELVKGGTKFYYRHKVDEVTGEMKEMSFTLPYKTRAEQIKADVALQASESKYGQNDFAYVGINQPRVSKVWDKGDWVVVETAFKDKAGFFHVRPNKFSEFMEENVGSHYDYIENVGPYKLGAPIKEVLENSAIKMVNLTRKDKAEAANSIEVRQDMLKSGVADIYGGKGLVVNGIQADFTYLGFDSDGKLAWMEFDVKQKATDASQWKKLVGSLYGKPVMKSVKKKGSVDIETFAWMFEDGWTISVSTTDMGSESYAQLRISALPLDVFKAE